QYIGHSLARGEILEGMLETPLPGTQTDSRKTEKPRQRERPSKPKKEASPATPAKRPGRAPVLDDAGTKVPEHPTPATTPAPASETVPVVVRPAQNAQPPHQRLRPKVEIPAVGCPVISP
ncbi:uncharacterized protein METZ01_LOCUS382696, partial [marine metagenome]